MRINRGVAGTALALLVPMALSGCAVVNPYVRACDKDVLANPSMDKAVTYAAETRQAYYDGIRDHTLFNRTAGVALIGTAAAAAALGIEGGSSTLITELGVGGAGLFGVSRILYSDRRLRVYAAGAQAITCTLGTFGPLRGVRQEPLRAANDELGKKAAALKAALDLVSRSPLIQENSRVVGGRSVLAAAMATGSRAHEALGRLTTAGIRLYDAVEETRSAVNKALLEDEPDLAQVVASAHSSILTQAGVLTGTSLTSPTTGGIKARIHDPEQEELVNRVEELAVETEAARLRVEALLADLGSAPTAEQLKACAFNPDEVGVTLRTDPSGGVTIDPAKNAGKVTIVVRGGKALYHTTWFGSDPGTDIVVGALDYSEGGKQATFTLKAASGAHADTYRLLVTDSGAGRAPLDVVIGGGGGGGGGGGTPAPPPLAQPPDPKTMKVQTNLIAMGCLKDPLPNGKAAADGVWGVETLNAFEDMLRAIKTNPDDYYAGGTRPLPPTPKLLDQIDHDVSTQASKSTWTACTPSPKP